MPPPSAAGSDDILEEYQRFNDSDWSAVTPTDIAGMMEPFITMSARTSLYLLPDVLRSVRQNRTTDPMALDVYEMWTHAINTKADVQTLMTPNMQDCIDALVADLDMLFDLKT